MITYFIVYYMKAYTEYLWMNTSNRKELVNITDRVYQALLKSKIKEGFALVSAMHITAGIFVNDDEPGFHKDLMKWLETLAPYKPDYEHHKTGENNGDAHLKNIIVHHQVIVPITEGKLDLGPWQQIFYAEFDGCRRKRIIIKIIGI